ncbi:MAG: metallophosphoesterase [Thermoanaerobaculales bacterium]|jgi:predicted MPP superfamily phosphohydrolase|nr:metallophosphoesterase [Thermoanaerobaculales bacterium]
MSMKTRRRFISMAGLAGASALIGLPSRASWAARGARAGTLRLVFYTDVHALPDWGAPEAVARVSKAVNATRPELVIGGGDLIYDAFETTRAASKPQWDTYMSMHRGIDAPVEVVLGNHDLTAVKPADGSDPSADPRKVFRNTLGLDRTWRVVEADGHRIFLLDSVEIGGEHGYRGGVSAEQIDWLRSEIGRTDTDTPVILVTHLPLLSAIPLAAYGATSPVTKNILVVNNREVLKLFAEHNLVLVLQGHLHAEEMLRWGGTTFITGGAVCGDKWRGPRLGTPEGFGVLTLRRDRIDWKYQSINWEARRPM